MTRIRLFTIRNSTFWCAGILLCLAATAYATSGEARRMIRAGLGIDPLQSQTPAEPESPFRIEGQRITVPRELVSAAGLRWRRVEPVDAARTLRLTGRTGLNLDTVAHVHTQFPGRLVSLGRALGDEVRAASGSEPGTLLCQIESVDLAQAKSDYLKARVQLSVEEDTLSRTTTLLQSGVVSDKAQFDAENAVRRSVADLDAARQKLMVFGLTEADLGGVEKQVGRERTLYDVRAPRSGVIVEKNVTSGELADTSVNLFTIADTGTLWVWGDVYERDWRSVRVGQGMDVEVAGRTGEAVRCTIDWISPVIDGSSRSVRVRGMIPNPDRRLLADMFATLTVTLDPGAGSLVVPKTALVRRADKACAFVVVSETGSELVFERRPVETEHLDAGADRLVRGLSAGESVLVEGALRLDEEMGR